MRFRYRLFAVGEMAFYALEGRILRPCVRFKIHRAAFVNGRRHVAHRARIQRDAFRRRIHRVHFLDVVARRTLHLRVASKLVPERRGRIAVSPRQQHDLVADRLYGRGVRVEIGLRQRLF